MINPPMADNDERLRWEKGRTYSIQGIDMEIGKSCDFKILCNGKLFIVAVRPSSQPDDPLAALVSEHSIAMEAGDDEEEQRLQNEIDDVIYEAGWRKFAMLAPAVEDKNKNKTSSRHTSLHSHLYPPTFHFRLTFAAGEAKLVEADAPGSTYQPFQLVTCKALKLPSFSAREIVFSESLPGLGFLARVAVNGQAMCCKVGKPLTGKAVQREYDCLAQVMQAGSASSIRVPRLTGYVLNNEKKIVGILEEFIPHECTLYGLKKGSIAADRKRREKWIQQLRETIDQLHRINVVWGDGKPENILVNSKTQDICVVDFGGSFTDGWVDERIKETVEGDEQAVRKIMDFLSAW